MRIFLYFVYKGKVVVNFIFKINSAAFRACTVEIAAGKGYKFVCLAEFGGLVVSGVMPRVTVEYFDRVQEFRIYCGDIVPERMGL